MLDLNIIERMQSAISSSVASPKNKFSKNNFYSLLIKHQLSMIQAWNPSKSDSSSGIPDFNQSLLKFKNNQNSPVSRPNINTVLQSYNDAIIPKTHSSFPELVNQIAQKNNVPQRLFQKLIKTESAFDQIGRASCRERV